MKQQVPKYQVPREEEHLPDQQLDRLLQQRLQDYESVPPVENWEQLEGRLPWSPLIRQLAVYGLRIAVVGLLILIAAQWYYGDFTFSKNTLVSKISYQTVPSFQALPEQAIPTKILVPSTIPHPPLLFSVEEDLLEVDPLDALLMSILQNDEDLKLTLDSTQLANILAPAIPPDSLHIMAMMEEPKEVVEEDLQITIPLQVIDEAEVDRFLRIYETIPPQ